MEEGDKEGNVVGKEKKKIVDLFNLAEAMKRRSLGRNVCCCVLFELLTD